MALILVELVAMRKTLQAAKVLASETTPGCLQPDEARVCRCFVVGVLGSVPPAVSVDDTGQGVLIRGSTGKPTDPSGLRLIAHLHDASMT